MTNNPKVDVIDGDKYRFKPVLNVHDRRGLLRLLDKHDMHGLGGILLEEVEESVPNAAKALKVELHGFFFWGFLIYDRDMNHFTSLPTSLRSLF